MQTNFEILHNAMNEIIQIYERSYMNPENFKQYQIAKKAINSMKDFNAEMARANSKKVSDDEIDEVLSQIEIKSKLTNETLLHVYRVLKLSTIKALESKGFKVHSHEDVEFYTIEW